MPGGQLVTAAVQRLLQEGAELDAPVAQHTGVGGAPRLVVGHEGVDDLLPEGLGHLHGVVGEAHGPGDLTGVPGRVLPGTGGKEL